MMRSKIETRARINNWFDKNADSMISDLKTLIGIKSIAVPTEGEKPFGDGPAEVLAAATEMLKKRGYSVRNFENTIITADMNDHEPILGSLTHLDTVAAGDGWDSDPFAATIRDGRIFGRGTSDDKGPSVAVMYAMYAAHELEPEMTKGFRLILGSAEEIGCVDIKHYLMSEKMPPNVFSPDANYPIVNVEKGRFIPTFAAFWQEDAALPRVVTIKGGDTENTVPHHAEAVIEGIAPGEVSRYCAEYSKETGAVLKAETLGQTVRITAEGKSAHASTPENGLNAQTALISMLAAMPFADSAGFRAICALNRIFPHGDFAGKALGIAMSGDIAGVLTMNFGVLDFGPTGLMGNFDCRTPECATEDNVCSVACRVLSDAGFMIRDSEVTPCHITPEDGELVRTLLGIYEDYTGEKGECLALGGSTYAHYIEGGVAFGCEIPGIDNRIHGANEYIGIDQMMISAKMFTQAIIDICS